MKGVLVVDRVVYLPTDDDNTTVATRQRAWIWKVGQAQFSFSWTFRPNPESMPSWVSTVTKVQP